MHDDAQPPTLADEPRSAQDASDGPQGLRVGSVLEQTYRLVERIGGGGMAEVFVASHARLAGRFAIKALNRELARNKEALVRFGREAAVLSSLRHPNVVQVFDFNVSEDGTPYLVMELLEGRDLRRALDDDFQQPDGARVPPERMARIVRQIAAGLAAAHAAGVVHRDLKPANVVLVPVPGHPDFVKVLDFGISKVMWSVQLTLQSAIIGTPEYMAPEQAEGRLESIDHLTDQFALAAMTYALLAGRDPFRGETPLAVLYQVVNAEPDPLGRFVDWPAAGVDAVLRRALSKRPADRFPDVLAFAEAFEIAVREAGMWVPSAASAVGLPAMIAPREPAEPPRVRRWRRAETALVGVGATLLGTVVGLASVGDRWARVQQDARAAVARAWPSWRLDALAGHGPASLALPIASTKPKPSGHPAADDEGLAPGACGREAMDPSQRAARDRCVASEAQGWQPVLTFWLGDAAKPWTERARRWFSQDASVNREFGRQCAARFGGEIERAARGELDGWRSDPRGALALVVLLDQLPRTAFRDTPRAFAYDAKALAVALEAHAKGFDRALAPVERALLAMPLMHAEDRGLAARSAARFAELVSQATTEDEQAVLASSSDAALRHQEIVERFGRYPHRNAIVGRASTADEEAFLAQPGARL